MDFELPDDLNLPEASVCGYVQSRLEPLARQVEHRDSLPDQILQEMCELGYIEVPVAEGYGEMGATELGY